jgi:hypothetical protein
MDKSTTDKTGAAHPGKYNNNLVLVWKNRTTETEL